VILAITRIKKYHTTRKFTGFCVIKFNYTNLFNEDSVFNEVHVLIFTSRDFLFIIFRFLTALRNVKKIGKISPMLCL